MSTPIKPIVWVSSTLDDLKKFPKKVQQSIGYALGFAQRGYKHPNARPLKGFSGAGVLEIIEDFSGDTYRAVYTVRFSRTVYVLHVFQKKSKQSNKTPKQEIDLIKKRYDAAKREHEKENR